jgi:dTDP-glucose 4,6-dehydratase
MKTILITGGAGFIGSGFTHYIFNKYKEYKILLLDCLTYAGAVENFPIPIWTEKHPRFEFWYGNILNAELVDTLVSQSDMIVHFAAESHVTRSIYDNSQFFMTDVIGTQNIANAVCKYSDRIEKFIHISTSEVYGTAFHENEPMCEKHPINPKSPYAGAKAGADRLVYSYWATYNIPAVIVRPFNNYGPRQHLEKVVPRFITSVLLNEDLHIHGQGKAARDFIFVEDTCSAIDLLLHASVEKVAGEVFNVGTGVDRTVDSIADNIIGVMSSGNKKYIGERPGQVIRHTADFSKIRNMFDWKPEVDWEEGIKRTINWYKENQKWWEKQKWMREIPVITVSGKRELH